MWPNINRETHIRAKTRSFLRGRKNVYLLYFILRSSFQLLLISDAFIFVGSLLAMYFIVISSYFIHLDLQALHVSLYFTLFFHYILYKSELEGGKNEKQEWNRKKLRWNISETLNIVQVNILDWWRK